MAMTILILLTVSAGMFVASTGIYPCDLLTYLYLAYLPSTFAMYGTTLAHAIALQPPSRLRTIKMFTTMGVTAILSWPFAAILASVLFLCDIIESERTRARFLQLCHGFIIAVGLVAVALVLPDYRSYFLMSN